MAEYRTSIDIRARPETVFDFLVTEAGLTTWMGEHAVLRPEPGGTFAADIAGHPIRGVYLHVERPQRVVVSWGIAGSEALPAGSSTVEFVLTAVAGGTRVELTHTGLPDVDVPGHAQGWGHFLPRLAEAAAGVPIGPSTWRP